MFERSAEKEVGENSNNGFSVAQLEVLFGHVSRMMRVELGPLTERMNRLEVSTSWVRTNTKSRTVGKRTCGA